jgi:hypothetical protein
MHDLERAEFERVLDIVSTISTGHVKVVEGCRCYRHSNGTVWYCTIPDTDRVIACHSATDAANTILTLRPTGSG